MSLQPVYNSALCRPTLLYDLDQFDDPSGIMGFLLKKGDPDVERCLVSPDAIGNALDFYICNMLAACAQTVSIPAYGHRMWASPGQLKSLLSDSGAKRLRFVDRSQVVWTAVERYLKPVHDDMQKSWPGEGKKGYPPSLDIIAWDVYLLCLAVRGHSEAPGSPSRTLEAIHSLGTRFRFGAESRARLATVRGVFTLFGTSTDIPGFTCVPGRIHSLVERVDEILDDAYLLDASRLRRFLGLQPNIRAIRRDLRKLLAFIAKNRPWAKGALVASSQAAAIPASAAEVTDKLLALIPGAATEHFSPVLISPESFVNSDEKLLVVSSRRVPFRKEESWNVDIWQHPPTAQQPGGSRQRCDSAFAPCGTPQARRA
jgi:hypothetical protein